MLSSRRARLAALLLVGLAPLTLGGCGGSVVTEATEREFPVADGVRQQYAVLAAEVDEKGQTATVGEWTVHMIAEVAEPWHEVHGHGHAELREPARGETNHIEIVPVETATGRVVPDVPITVEVLADDGRVVEKRELAFYYATFFHYASNFSIREPGSYTLRATLGAPTFNRHTEPGDAPALTTGTTVEFSDVDLGAES